MKMDRFKLYLNAVKCEQRFSVTLNEGQVSSLKTIWVDGGVRHRTPQEHPQHHIWIGDADSSSKPNAQNFEEVVDLKKDKDVSDFGVTLDFVQNNLNSQHLTLIEIWGVFGGRIDHEYTNVFELNEFVLKNKNVVIAAHPYAVFANRSFDINQMRNSFFSVHALMQNTKLKIEGARYHQSVTLNRPSHGLSNQAVEDSLQVKLDSGACILWVGEERHV